MSYAIVIGDTATELFHGAPFTDAFGIQHPPNTLDFWSPEELAEINAFPIVEADPAPDGQRIASLTLSVVDGVPTRVATYEPVPVDVRKASMVAQAQTISETYTAYPVTAGTMAGETLQVRNDTDRTNWLGLQAICQAQIAAGHGDVAGAPLRTTSNTNFTITFNEAAQVLIGIPVWQATVYQRLWAIKDAITAAVTDADLDAIDVTTGWP